MIALNPIQPDLFGGEDIERTCPVCKKTHHCKSLVPGDRMVMCEDCESKFEPCLEAHPSYGGQPYVEGSTYTYGYGTTTTTSDSPVIWTLAT